MPPTRQTYEEEVIGLSAVFDDLLVGIRSPFGVIREIHRDRIGECRAIIEYPQDGRQYEVTVKYAGPE